MEEKNMEAEEKNMEMEIAEQFQNVIPKLTLLQRERLLGICTGIEIMSDRRSREEKAG